MSPLTDRQREVLMVIADYRKRHQYSPAVRDLCELLDIASTNGVNDHLKALDEKGYITRTRGIPRSMFLTREGLAEVQP